MKEKLDQEVFEMVQEYIKVSFPKKRVKVSPKRFKRAIEIPATLNDGMRYVYAMEDKSNLDILFLKLFGILKNVFYGFDLEIINTALYYHLGLKS